MLRPEQDAWRPYTAGMTVNWLTAVHGYNNAGSCYRGESPQQAHLLVMRSSSGTAEENGAEKGGVGPRLSSPLLQDSGSPRDADSSAAWSAERTWMALPLHSATILLNSGSSAAASNSWYLALAPVSTSSSGAKWYPHWPAELPASISYVQCG